MHFKCKHCCDTPYVVNSEEIFRFVYDIAYYMYKKSLLFPNGQKIQKIAWKKSWKNVGNSKLFSYENEPNLFLIPNYFLIGLDIF